MATVVTWEQYAEVCRIFGGPTDSLRVDLTPGPARLRPACTGPNDVNVFAPVGTRYNPIGGWQGLVIMEDW